jgi:uncharacterized protein DUF3108
VKVVAQNSIRVAGILQSFSYDLCLKTQRVICILCVLCPVAPLLAQTTRPITPATISAAPGPRIIPPPSGYRFPNGQSYVYGVEWHLFNAGTATVKMDAAGAEQRVTALGDSAGFVNAFYKVHDFLESRFDPRSFCSLHVSKHLEEGSRKRQTELAFDYGRHKSMLNDKNLKSGDSKHTENDIPSCVTDVVSGFYYLASLPLEPGTFNTFVVSDGAKTTNVTAHVEARERVKVPAGTYQTIRIKAEPDSGPLKGKTTIVVWFTDDANHMPVQMRSKLGWGTLMFRLQRLETR